MSALVNRIRLYWPLIKSMQTGLLLATGIAGYISAHPLINQKFVIRFIMFTNFEQSCWNINHNNLPEIKDPRMAGLLLITDNWSLITA